MATPRRGGGGGNNSNSNSSSTGAGTGAGVGKACRFCSRHFAKTEHLIRHERCHTKERPFQCSICGKNYSRNDTLIRHRRTHGNNTAVVPPDVFSNNDAATTSDGTVNPPITPVTGRMSSSHQPMSSISSSIAASDYTDHDFNTSPVEYHPMGNEMYGHDMYAQPDLGPGPYQHMNGGATAMPQIDPSLTGGRDNPGAGNNNMDFSTSYLDPALHQYPPPSEANGYQMPYTAPEIEQFQSWYLTNDFDLAVFNKSFKTPTAAEFLGISGPLSDHQWKNHDMPSSETGGNLPLHMEWDQVLVPSVEFMNITIQFFFTKFNPIFPIFHGPTFRPADHSPLLLLSISSIGSLLINSDQACLRGAKMFETVQKTVTESWATAESKPLRERTSFIQAALISQFFAYLSGSPKYLALVKPFHVNLTDLARRCGILDIARTLPDVSGKPQEELDVAWNSWARDEEISRTALGLYIHDAQFASTFNNAPILQHNALRLFVASTDELFGAVTPTRWAHLIRLSPDPSKLSTHLHVNQAEHVDTAPLSKELSCRESRFSCYVILHSIGASVQASRVAGTLTPKQMQNFEEALICWYHAYEQTRTTQDPDPLCLMVLYHEIFMTLLVDFSQLESAIGGPAKGADAITYARNWSTSIEAKRCIIHASLIHRQCEGIPFHSEPALHVPRSMFLAARAWYCYIQFDPSVTPVDGSSSTPQTASQQQQQQMTYEESFNIPEVKMFNIDPMQYLPAVNGFGTGKPQLTEAATLCRLADLLEQIGRWGISRRFARILRVLIFGPAAVGVNGNESGVVGDVDLQGVGVA
ncbi:hypothetical protein ONS95_010960 [Cadophora gregata]|uniref:uncharacterized protein n=1 Tax=Cadophora gregata TaxID=51156 RepID=UPI0026DCFE41|nr:uncharacterized protein ONS95_010960 [Cadophora gregata]KAK0119518.1 hypothetical protein ONS95_010960 [Cadophora gregata]